MKSHLRGELRDVSITSPAPPSRGAPTSTTLQGHEDRRGPFCRHHASVRCRMRRRAIAHRPSLPRCASPVHVEKVIFWGLFERAVRVEEGTINRATLATARDLRHTRIHGSARFTKKRVLSALYARMTPFWTQVKLKSIIYRSPISSSGTVGRLQTSRMMTSRCMVDCTVFRPHLVFLHMQSRTRTAGPQGDVRDASRSCSTKQTRM